MKLPIYFDNHATTPLDPRVLEAMLPYFTDKFGNAASRNHSFGWVAEEAVEIARAQIAKLIGATAKEIIFTSGATESTILPSRASPRCTAKKGTISSLCVTEHKAVLDTCKHLEKWGYRVTYLPVNADGLIRLDDLKRAMEEKTILVSIMFANNEIGVIQPVAEIGKLCREKGVLFHTDAVQAVGKVPVDVNALNIDMLSLSGHKIYGPKGVGALMFAARTLACSSLTDRWRRSQRGMRSGTLNVPGYCGTGQGSELAMQECPRNPMASKIFASPDEQNVQRSRHGIHKRQHGRGKTSPRQPQHELSLRRRRVAVDGNQ